MSAEEVHFSITGEWLTSTARDRWAESPASALRILHDAIPELTEDQRLGICEGRLKLVGVNHLQLVPDTAKGTSTTKRFEKLEAELAKSRLEAQFLSELASDDTVTVASPTGRRRIPRAAAALYRGGATLKEDFSWDDAPRKGTTVLSTYVKVDNFGAPPSAGPLADARIEYAPEPSLTRFPEPIDHIDANGTGWLSPAGVFHPCKYHEHTELESLLTNDEYELEKKGWVKLQRAGETRHIFGFLNDFDEFTGKRSRKVRPTRKQKAVVLDYCTKFKLDPPHWLTED